MVETQTASLDQLADDTGAQDVANVPWVDYALTYLTSICLIGMLMLTYRVAAYRFGELGLSQYAVMRRIIAFVQPPLALGMAIALSRKVTECRFKPRLTAESSYSLAALVLIVGLTATICLPLVCFPRWFGYAIFGAGNYHRHTVALCPMLAGLGVHTVCYARLHGRLSMRFANLLQLLNVGILPIVMMLWAPTVSDAFVWTGSVVTFASLLALSGQYRHPYVAIRGIRPAIGELLRLGPRRVPGDIAYAGLFMLPAMAVAHSRGVKEAGLVAIGLTLLTLAQTVTAPISTLLLPQATAMLRHGNVAPLRSKVLGYVLISSAITAVGVVLFWLYVDPLLQIWIGRFSSELPVIVKLLIIGALPLNLHTCLRSIVDAGRDDAANARNCCLSVAFFIIAFASTMLIVDDLYASLLAMLGALFFLAILTSWEVWRIIGPSSDWSNGRRYSFQNQAA